MFERREGILKVSVTWERWWHVCMAQGARVTTLARRRKAGTHLDLPALYGLPPKEDACSRKGTAGSTLCERKQEEVLSPIKWLRDKESKGRMQ